jgi:hypothetical protein
MSGYIDSADRAKFSRGRAGMDLGTIASLRRRDFWRTIPDPAATEIIVVML